MKYSILSGRSLGAWVMLVALLSLFAAACGQSDSAKEVLLKAKESMATLQAYQFEGSLASSDENGTAETKQSGEWSSPGSYHLKTESEGHVNETTIVNLRVYNYDSTYPERGWRAQPLHNMGVTAPTFDFLGQLTGVEMVERNATIEEVPVYHITGILPLEADRARHAVEQLDPKDPFREEKLVSIARWRTGYAVYITKEEHRVVRVVHELYMEGWESVSSAGGTKTFSTVPVSERTVTNYDSFNQPVTIVAPGT